MRSFLIISLAFLVPAVVLSQSMPPATGMNVNQGNIFTTIRSSMGKREIRTDIFSTFSNAIVCAQVRQTRESDETVHTSCDTSRYNLRTVQVSRNPARSHQFWQGLWRD